MGKTKHAAGRKLLLLLRPKLTEELAGLLREGVSVRSACEATAFGESTFYDWLRRSDPNEPDHAPELVAFAETIRRARGFGKIALVRLIQKHALNDGRLALELLSRIAPDEFGRSRRDDPAEGMADGAPLTIYLAPSATQAEAARLRELLPPSIRIADASELPPPRPVTIERQTFYNGATR